MSGCIAYGNTKHGIAENETLGLLKVFNNVLYMNTLDGIVFDGADVASVYRNNIAYANVRDNFSGAGYASIIIDHNSYDDTRSLDGITVRDDDFVSLDTLQLYKPRNADPSLPVIHFLKLKPNSRLVDAGIEL